MGAALRNSHRTERYQYETFAPIGVSQMKEKASDKVQHVRVLAGLADGYGAAKSMIAEEGAADDCCVAIRTARDGGDKSRTESDETTQSPFMARPKWYWVVGRRAA